MSEYVVANATVVPVRENPSEGAEQLTQLLFGEVCEVLDRLPRWTKIRSTLDTQEGWVDFKMVTLTSEPSEQLALRVLNAPVVATPMATATPMDGGADLLLTLGTRLPNYSHGTFEVLGQQYIIDPTCVSTAQRSRNDCPIVAQRPLPLGWQKPHGYRLLRLHTSGLCGYGSQPLAQRP